MRDRRVRVGALVLVALALASCTTGTAPESAATTPPRTISVEPSGTAPPGVEVPDLTEASCEEIRLALGGAREAVETALSDLGAAPEAFAQVAANLRAAAADAEADLSAAVEELAAGFEEIADKIRTGDLRGLNLDSLLPALDRLDQMCNS